MPGDNADLAGPPAAIARLDRRDVSGAVPGGTADERSLRTLLREAMESQGFKVNPTEWWHFDYKDWKEYPILNVKFEDLKQ